MKVINFQKKESAIEDNVVWKMLCDRIEKDFTANGFHSHIESFKKHFKPTFDLFSSEGFSISAISESNPEYTTWNDSIESILLEYRTHIAKLLAERYDREIEFYCLKYLSSE